MQRQWHFLLKSAVKLLLKVIKLFNVILVMQWFIANLIKKIILVSNQIGNINLLRHNTGHFINEAGSSSDLWYIMKNIM